jgi:RNA polymerase-binding transcription factor DksA
MLRSLPREEITSAVVGTLTGVLEELRALYAELVAAEQGSNADDEHDPEGATLAFERQQLLAVIQSLEAKQEEIAKGTTGLCEVCGNPIGAERLEARPYARTCVDCARRA